MMATRVSRSSLALIVTGEKNLKAAWKAAGNADLEKTMISLSKMYSDLADAFKNLILFDLSAHADISILLQRVWKNCWYRRIDVCRQRTRNGQPTAALGNIVYDGVSYFAELCLAISRQRRDLLVPPVLVAVPSDDVACPMPSQPKVPTRLDITTADLAALDSPVPPLAAVTTALVYIGDMLRYAGYPTEIVAAAYHRAARITNRCASMPQLASGAPFNQLAVLLSRTSLVEGTRYYIQAIACHVPFPMATNNMKLIFSNAIATLPSLEAAVDAHLPKKARTTQSTPRQLHLAAEKSGLDLTVLQIVRAVTVCAAAISQSRVAEAHATLDRLTASLGVLSNSDLGDLVVILTYALTLPRSPSKNAMAAHVLTVEALVDVLGAAMKGKDHCVPAVLALEMLEAHPDLLLCPRRAGDEDSGMESMLSDGCGPETAVGVITGAWRPWATRLGRCCSDRLDTWASCLPVASGTAGSVIPASLAVMANILQRLYSNLARDLIRTSKSTGVSPAVVANLTPTTMPDDLAFRTFIPLSDTLPTDSGIEVERSFELSDAESTGLYKLLTADGYTFRRFRAGVTLIAWVTVFLEALGTPPHRPWGPTETNLPALTAWAGKHGVVVDGGVVADLISRLRRRSAWHTQEDVLFDGFEPTLQDDSFDSGLELDSTAQHPDSVHAFGSETMFGSGWPDAVPEGAGVINWGYTWGPVMTTGMLDSETLG
ncbi:Est1 DNA/RNA binding domain [Carpediemonas membranifera]|uniref:Est1 DNA/RNA binding domain n=1 Tax=Carpediemonas membranifera TaxID=201153 RepID=A0A8J6BAX1_9EUKA|nr:Est1 DNA/RNA binding domain [Carpediemonas membranifera]|eukprot:KAG9396914.1 Est1 DNA/RNA binding domain [Carpediemonas membranifera]